MRLFRFIHQIRQTCDYTIGLVLIPLLVVAVWLMSLPFSATVQHATLRRFQMQTPYFWQWAIQQPIPAMYNVENRAQVSIEGLAEPTQRFAEPRYLNHFPYRLLTFGDARFDFLRYGRPVRFQLESSYRGALLHTEWEAIPQTDGGHEIVLRGVLEE